jgi:tetraacyldisaccharide 4'-kinase
MLSSTVPVAVAGDRADGLALAMSQGATVIVMDDGFQNPAIAKDAALIVIDAQRGLGNECVFPAGPLRAPLAPQIERTDALVVVGEGTAADRLAKMIAAQHKPVLTAQLKPQDVSLAALRGKRVLALAGIGDPGRFFRMLRANGIEVISQHAYADHHCFSKDEIEALIAEAKQSALTLVTTEKDLARLSIAGGLPTWAQGIVPFEVRLEFDNPAKLRKFVSDRLHRARNEKLKKR